MAKVKLVLNLSLLAAVVAAGTNGMFVAAADSAPFTSAKPPLMEVNTDVKDENGNLATRATEAGVAYAAANPPGATVEAAAEKPKFNIVVTKLPEIKRGTGGAKTSKYPFDDLPAATKDAEGNILSPSFFIPATAEMPDPAKKLASTVSSATRRHAVVGDPPKKTVQRAKKDANGDDVKDAAGNVVKEAVEIDNMKQTRQFVIRAETDGAIWGSPGVAGASIHRIDLG